MYTCMSAELLCVLYSLMMLSLSIVAVATNGWTNGCRKLLVGICFIPCSLLP